ncbi:hypothetical protein LPJ71_008175, partial [Coemansia sp. S17]
MDNRPRASTLSIDTQSMRKTAAGDGNTSGGSRRMRKVSGGRVLEEPDVSHEDLTLHNLQAKAAALALPDSSRFASAVPQPMAMARGRSRTVAGGSSSAEAAGEMPRPLSAMLKNNPG